MRLRSMGARRVLVASALLALAALTVVAGGSAASTPEAVEAEGIVDVQWTPLGLRDAETTVVVQLAGRARHGRRGRRRACAEQGREAGDPGTT